VREAGGTDFATGPVRLGAFATAAAGLVPAAISALGPEPRVTMREGTTPQLTRAVRAGTSDLAVLARVPPFRPPDAESPALELLTLSERDLLVAVGDRHPFAGRRAVEVEELHGQVWVASRSDAGESLLGVWPGLDERADVRFVVRDWLAKLQIVAAGLAITTSAPVAAGVVPGGVRTVGVRGEPHEVRRLVVARQPGPLDPAVAAVQDALVAAAR
jgi:hypothetical protein